MMEIQSNPDPEYSEKVCQHDQVDYDFDSAKYVCRGCGKTSDMPIGNPQDGSLVGKEVIFPTDDALGGLSGRGAFVISVEGKTATLNFHDNSNDPKMYSPAPLDIVKKYVKNPPEIIASHVDKSSDEEMLREAIASELDAINLYERMAQGRTLGVRRVLLDIAKEEKTHVGEFQALLLKVDGQQKKELDEGGKEALGKFKKNPCQYCGYPLEDGVCEKCLAIENPHKHMLVIAGTARNPPRQKVWRCIECRKTYLIH